jgi:hypothetical protein
LCRQGQERQREPEQKSETSRKKRIQHGKNIMTATKIGKNCNVNGRGWCEERKKKEKNYIFLLLLLTFYLVIVCYVEEVRESWSQNLGWQTRHRA